MSNSIYTSQAQEEQQQLELLNNYQFDTVNTDNSSSSGGFKPVKTINKVGNFLREVVYGIDAAKLYTNGGVPGATVQPVNYTQQIPQQNTTNAALPWILGAVVVGSGIYYIINQK